MSNKSNSLQSETVSIESSFMMLSNVEEGVKDLASTAISAAGAMASSGVTVNINSTSSTEINLSSSGAATLTPSLIPSYSLSFSTSGSAIAIDQSMIFAQMTTGGNGGYTKPIVNSNDVTSPKKTDIDDGSSYLTGSNGTQVSSKTTWKNGKTERIDVENPSPGKRPGQVHYHDANNNKYYYDIVENVFYNQKTGKLAPKSVQNLLKDEDFMKGIIKALQILGE